MNKSDKDSQINWKEKIAKAAEEILYSSNCYDIVIKPLEEKQCKHITTK